MFALKLHVIKNENTNKKNLFLKFFIALTPIESVFLNYGNKLKVQII